MGEEGIDRSLREQYDRHSFLHGLVTTSSSLDIDGGLLINRLSVYLGGHVKRLAFYWPCREVPFYRKCYKVLFEYCSKHWLSTRSAPH